MRMLTRVANGGARRIWTWRNKSSFERRADGEKRSRLLVDVSAIIRHDAQTGIQRVVRAVWSELARRSGAGFDVLPVFASHRRGYCYAPKNFLDERPFRFHDEPVGMESGDRFLGLDLAAHLLPKYRDQLRAWRGHGARIHVVVYDLLPLQRPEWFNSAAVGHFRKWFNVLTSEVDQAICISESVARDLAAKLQGMPRPAIGRLYMGGDMAASRPSTGISAKVMDALDIISRRPTILMVGTVEPRKGYEVALSAFEHLWRVDPKLAPDLVIIGKGGWKTSELQAKILSHPQFSKRLHWFDRVSDEGLCKFYEASRGVLVTSRGEGFGLPLIEAAAHHRHVLARDLSVFREQQLSNVLFFSDDRPGPLGHRLMDLLNASRASPAATVLPTWSECVDAMLIEMGLQTGKIPR